MDMLVLGVLAIGLAVVAIVVTLYQFAKMDKNPKNYRRPKSK